MAFATLADDSAFNTRMAADVIWPALFCFIDWPSTPIYATTHHQSVTVDSITWSGVGRFGSIEVDGAKQSGAAQRWRVGLKGVPATPVLTATQASAVGVDAEIYVGLFDSDWTDPILSLFFAGYFGGRQSTLKPSEDGMVLDISGEISDLVSPRRSVQSHWAPGLGEDGDTAQKLLYTVARTIPWPG